MKIKIILLTAFMLFSSSSFPAFNHVTMKQVEAAQGIIQHFGYACDSVDEMQPFVMGGGFNVYCNGWKYHYELEDKGGKWSITVK
jgi:hypothetical protein